MQAKIASDGTLLLKVPADNPRYRQLVESLLGDDDQPHDTKDLAELYAEMWHRTHPYDVGHHELATAHAELHGGTHGVNWDGDKWHVSAMPRSVVESVLLEEVRHAPKGEGITIKGKHFKPGQFIPLDAYKQATPDQKAAIDKPAEAAATARKARGSVDHDKLSSALAPHAHHELTVKEKSSAKRSFNALHRHHGELVVHRLEELANELQKAHDREGNTEGQTEQYSRRLRAVQHQVEMAKEKGLHGVVEKKANGPHEMTAKEWGEARHKEDMNDDYRKAAAPLLKEAWEKGIVTGSDDVKTLTAKQVERLFDKHSESIPGKPLAGSVARGDFGASSMYGGEYWLSQTPGGSYMVVKNNKDFGPNLTHKREVEKALAAGKPVPPEVLADYPDLQPKGKKSPEKTKQDNNIVRDIGSLSSGTLAKLFGTGNMAEIDQEAADWQQWAAAQPGKFETWQDAWEAYKPVLDANTKANVSRTDEEAYAAATEKNLAEMKADPGFKGHEQNPGSLNYNVVLKSLADVMNRDKIRTTTGDLARRWHYPLSSYTPSDDFGKIVKGMSHVAAAELNDESGPYEVRSAFLNSSENTYDKTADQLTRRLNELGKQFQVVNDHARSLELKANDLTALGVKSDLPQQLHEKAKNLRDRVALKEHNLTTEIARKAEAEQKAAEAAERASQFRSDMSGVKIQKVNTKKLVKMVSDGNMLPTAAATGYATDGRFIVKLNDKDKAKFEEEVKAGANQGGRKLSADQIKHVLSMGDNGPAKIAGVRDTEDSPAPVYLLQGEGKQQAIVDSRFHHAVLSQHPDAVPFMPSKANAPVTYKVGGEVVGAVVPLDDVRAEKGNYKVDDTPYNAPPLTPNEQGLKDLTDKAKPTHKGVAFTRDGNDVIGDSFGHFGITQLKDKDGKPEGWGVVHIPSGSSVGGYDTKRDASFAAIVTQAGGKDSWQFTDPKDITAGQVKHGKKVRELVDNGEYAKLASLLRGEVEPGEAPVEEKTAEQPSATSVPVMGAVATNETEGMKSYRDIDADAKKVIAGENGSPEKLASFADKHGLPRNALKWGDVEDVPFGWSKGKYRLEKARTLQVDWSKVPDEHGAKQSLNEEQQEEEIQRIAQAKEDEKRQQANAEAEAKLPFIERLSRRDSKRAALLSDALKNAGLPESDAQSVHEWAQISEGDGLSKPKAYERAASLWATKKKREAEAEPGKSSPNYANAVTIAADSVGELRKQDVHRVMDSMQDADTLKGMGEYITANRPELQGAVDEAAGEIAEERGYGKGEAKAKEPWEIDGQRDDESRDAYIKRMESITPRAKNTRVPTKEDVDLLRDKLRAIMPGLSVKQSPTKSATVDIYPPKSHGTNPFTPDEGNAIRGVLRELGYVDHIDGFHMRPTDSSTRLIGGLVLDADGPRKEYIGQPERSNKPNWEKTFDEFASSHPGMKKVEEARKSQGNGQRDAISGIGKIKDDHREDVSAALAAGRPVPPEVLADYPDLAAKYGKGADLSASVQADDGDDNEADEEVRKSYADKPKVELLRAPANGAISNVNGEFYKGGRLMPVHGLSPKKDKDKEGGSGSPSTPSKPNEDAKNRQRSAPREMTHEEIADEKQRRENQAKWDTIKSGPIGQVFPSLGERPHHINRADPGLKPWQAWADTVPDSKLQEVRDVARDIATKAVAEKEGDERAKEYRDYQDEYFADSPDSNAAKYMTKKHVNEKPTSAAAVHWFGQAVELGGIDAMHKLNEVMGDAGSATKPAEVVGDTAPVEPSTPDPETEHAGPLGEVPDPSPDTDPRQLAEDADKALKSDYEFARSSAIPNMGKDLKGAARHKVNAWRGLEQAEKDGTAESLMTRDNLLKNEPPDLLAKVTPANALSALASHLAVSSFPAIPYDDKTLKSYLKYHGQRTAEELRKQYYDAYQKIKDEAERLASSEVDPRKTTESLCNTVQSIIKGIRNTGKKNEYGVELRDSYNPVANGLCTLGKRLFVGYRSGKNDVINRVKDFSNRLGKAYGDTPTEDMLSKAAEHVKDVMEGDSFNKTFGTVESGKKGFDPATLYVKHANRRGGRVIDAASVEAGKNFMMNSLKMSGLQWGNSVTDSERQHHLQKSSEALADLADVLGLPDHAISLGSSLGLAIGARGHGSALAHYEPGKSDDPSSRVINLTRKNGVGSLSHEWGHALDHYLTGGKISSDGEKTGGDYMSNRTSARRVEKDVNGNYYKDENGRIKHTDYSTDPVWAGMNEVRKAMKESGFDSRLIDSLNKAIRDGEISRDKAANYWNSGHEKFARTFEVYVKHKLGEQGRENTYLSGVNNHPFWPNEEEITKIGPAMSGLMDAVRKKHFSDDGAGSVIESLEQENVLFDFLPRKDSPLGHEFASTQFNLADDADLSQASKVRAMAARIADADLAEGRESEPHITALYGLHSQDPSDVAEVVRGFGPVTVTFGATSVFPGDDHDVVIVQVFGQDLYRLNDMLRDSLEHTETHSQYMPHVTLAYVKPGTGEKYAGMMDLFREEATFGELVFSDREGEQFPIHLLADEEEADVNESLESERPSDVGPFIVHQFGKDWKVTHGATGLGTLMARDKGTAVLAAKVMGAKGDWSFTDPKRFGGEAKGHGRNVLRAVMEGNEGELQRMARELGV